jgi:hypothetical protein
MRHALALGLAAVLALVLALTAAAGNGNPFDTGSANVLTVAVYGDAPYGTTPTDTAEFQATPAFIDSVNADPKVDLVVHVGDIHSGKQFCTQAYDESVRDLWTAYKDPVVYTPGDNEWTDCHKAGEGGGTYNKVTHQIDYVLGSDGNPVDYAGGDPLANLALVRSLFFPQAGVTLGGRKKQVLSQGQAFDPAHPSDADYVENVMWEQSKTLFVTLNVPGGSNNDTDVWYGAPTASPEQVAEAANRTGADVRWLHAAFDRANADGVGGVVVILQADMWDVDGKSPAHLTQFAPILDELATATTAFAKPVLLFNGDSHQYRSDDPFSATAPCDGEAGPCASDYSAHPGYSVANFHRVVVHGSTFPLEWLRLTIDPRADAPASANAFGPFSWTRVQP